MRTIGGYTAIESIANAASALLGLRHENQCHENVLAKNTRFGYHRATVTHM